MNMLIWDMRKVFLLSSTLTGALTIQLEVIQASRTEANATNSRSAAFTTPDLSASGGITK